MTLDASDLDRLTPREREVLRTLAQGLSREQAAHRLGIHWRTLDTHTARVRDKLDLNKTLPAIIALLKAELAQ